MRVCLLHTDVSLHAYANMRRPLLRTKDGCLRCRARRKKCDNAKPICGSCRRLDLRCLWSRAEDLQAQNSSSEVQRKTILYAPEAYSVTRSLESYLHFTDQEEFNLVTQIPSCFYAITSNISRFGPGDFTLLLHIALESEFVRPAITAFVAYVLRLVTEEKRWERLTLENYQKAVVKAGQVISHGPSLEEAFGLHISACVLGMTEVSLLHCFVTCSQLSYFRAQASVIPISVSITSLLLQNYGFL